MSVLKVTACCCIILLCCTFNSHAQFKSNIGDTIVNAKLVSLGYGFQLPAGDMAKRFGINNNVAAGLTFKFGHDWLLGLEFNYMFGNNVKEDTILNQLEDSSGSLIGTNGNYETIFLHEAGYSVMAKFGKVFPVFKSNPNTGLFAQIGAGFLQHKIKLEDPNSQVPQVDGNYAKGYDRLTNGLAISQTIGYLHLDKRKLVNFSVCFDAQEGFTKNRRDWNFDQMKKDDSNRFDVLLGLKVAWIIPFYGSHEQKVYTY